MLLPPDKLRPCLSSRALSAMVRAAVVGQSTVEAMVQRTAYRLARQTDQHARKVSTMHTNGYR